ncbi:ATP-binding protein [Chloroflexota bacterium]
MEPIGEILKKKTPINTSKANMDTWSSASEDKADTTDTGCPVCKGAGFVHPLLTSGKPDYGRVISCRCTQETRDKERQSHLFRYSNLGSLARFTFEGLQPQGRSGNPVNQELFTRAYETAKDMAREPTGWLILAGPTSSGKTHLAAAIANQSISQGQPALFISVPDLLDRLRSAYNPGSETPYDEFFDQVKNAPLLILDDLGAQSSTPWAKEKLDQLLNFRFNRELPTVIATITPVNELDDRIRSRLTNPELSRHYLLEEEQGLAERSWGSEFELQKTMTFTSFKRRPNLSPEQQQNLEAALNLALSFAKSPEGWLVLMGQTGCGKTHLAAAIVNHHYQAGQPALFVVVPDFLDHLRSAFNPESKMSYDQLFEKVKTASLLVLDDFGEQTTTPWAREKLYQVINYRYNARLATIITTRYSLEEIREQIEGSISSRLVDHKISTPFNIVVPDYRGDINSSRKQAPRRRKKGSWD